MGLGASSAHAGVTFDMVKKKGFLQCGFAGIPGLSVLDNKGEWHGIDVDMCRAVSAAMFGDAAKVKGVMLSAQTKFTALQSGEIDMLARNTTLTLARDTTLGLIGVGVNFYDSQGMMVPKSLGVKSAKDLDGATVCVQPGSTSELNLADWFRGQKLRFKPVLVENYDEAFRLFETGRCDVYTNDKSNMAANRQTRLAKPDDYLARRDPELVRLWPERRRATPYEAWLVLHQDLARTARVRVVVEAITSAFPD
ncbi:hypothetical protein C6Q08_14695 [Burkholderia multivorans]|nr:hypothetical protein C6Q08_14695 [Burkholderia multivorans]